MSLEPRAQLPDTGERTVVLLHGLGADHRAFMRFQRLLPAEWSTTALDLLGHGSAPKPDSGYALEDHAEWIEEQIRQLAGGSAVTLLGHSYGAAVAVATAARAPQLVDDLVLLDAVVYDQWAGSHSGTDRAEGPAARMIRAKHDGNIAETVEVLFPSEGSALRAWILETWETMAAGVVENLDHDWGRFATQVRCNVGIVHGEVALGGAGTRAAEMFRDAFVNAGSDCTVEDVCIPGAGHFLHATHARETADAVARILGRVSA